MVHRTIGRTFVGRAPRSSGILAREQADFGAEIEKIRLPGMNRDSTNGCFRKRITDVVPFLTAVRRFPGIALIVAAECDVHDVVRLGIDCDGGAITRWRKRTAAGVIHLLPHRIGLHAACGLEHLAIVIPDPDKIGCSGRNGDRADSSSDASLDCCPNRSGIVGVVHVLVHSAEFGMHYLTSMARAIWKGTLKLGATKLVVRNSSVRFVNWRASMA